MFVYECFRETCCLQLHGRWLDYAEKDSTWYTEEKEITGVMYHIFMCGFVVYPEDEGIRFIQNVGTYPENYKVTHPTFYIHYHKNLKSHINQII